MALNRPEWLKIRVKAGHDTEEVFKLLNSLSLHTVCEEAACPNLCECFGRKTATFMILGRMCTRNCTFCNVEKGGSAMLLPPDAEEPRKVAEAVVKLGLRHSVITSVTRDDLPDGGAGHFARVIKEIRGLDGSVVIEVLIPDFEGNEAALATVAEAEPDIINHNIETVPRLYPGVRPQASYVRSLELLRRVKELDGKIITKSGIMVGLGEKREEVLGVLDDLRASGCDLLTMGQYLAPSVKHHPVIEYIHPDDFKYYKIEAESKGFRHVESAPFVRSSYMAEKSLAT